MPETGPRCTHAMIKENHYAKGELRGSVLHPRCPICGKITYPAGSQQ